MNNLSKNSMTKVFSCLKQKKEMNSIDSLRNTCSRLEQISNEKQFHKIEAEEIRIHLYTLTREPEINRLVVMTLTKKEPNQKSDRVFASTCVDGYMNIHKICSNDISFVQYKDMHSGKEYNTNEIIDNFLIRIFAKVNKTKQFSIFGLDLNNELVNTLKKYESIKHASILNIQKCNMDLSIPEMSDLLGRFDTLRSLCVAGIFKKQCLVDEHLFGIFGHIVICNGTDITGLRHPIEQQSADLHGLTSQLCHHWTNKPPKSVMFCNISTKIEFTAAWKMVSSVSPRKSTCSIEQDGHYKFGQIDVNPDFVKELAAIEQTKGYIWSIKEQWKRENKFKIESLTSASFIEFSVVLPYIKPNFTAFLVKLTKIKKSVETAVSFSSAEEGVIQAALGAIEQHMHEFEQNNKLSDPQVDQAVMRLREKAQRQTEMLIYEIDNIFVLARRINGIDRDELVDRVVLLWNVFHRNRQPDHVEGFRRTTLEDIIRLEKMIQIRLSQPAPVLVD